MSRQLARLHKQIVFIGVLGFALQLLFPQFAHAQVKEDISLSDQAREESALNVANISETFLFDPSDDSIEVIKLPEPKPTTTPTVSVKKKTAYQPVSETEKAKIKEYVLARAEELGLDKGEVAVIVGCESHWNPQAINTKNRNGSRDLGLWQINSIHNKKMSDADKLDYKKSTEWALKKRLHDGNWSAWYCARKYGIK